MDEVVVNFGDENAGNRMFKRPMVVLFHILFRAAALLVYVFHSNSENFIIGFLSIIFLLSLDFWMVKNISGRLLVGLRWWNFVDPEGNSHWKFESRKDRSGVRGAESQVFWAALIIGPLLWLIFAFLCFFTFKMAWLIVAIMGFCMNGANLYGYMRCKWSSRQEFSSYLSQTMFKSLLSRATEAPPAGSQ